MDNQNKSKNNEIPAIKTPPPPKSPAKLKPIMLHENFSLHEEVNIKKKQEK